MLFKKLVLVVFLAVPLALSASQRARSSQAIDATLANYISSNCKTFLTGFLSLSKGEAVWVENVGKGEEDICDELWEVAFRNRLKIQGTLNVSIVQAKKLTDFQLVLTYFSKLAKVSFFQVVVDKNNNNTSVAGKKPPMLNTDIKVLDSFPKMFDLIEKMVGEDLKDCRLRYLRMMYQDKVADGDTPSLDAEFIKYFIHGDLSIHGQETIKVLSRSIQQKSSKAVKMLNEFYNHIGVDAFEKLVHGAEFAALANYIPIFKGRTAVSVKVGKFQRVQDLVESAKFCMSEKDKKSPFSTLFYHSDDFYAYIRDLQSQKMLFPDPINGRLMFTNLMTEKQVARVIKMFKVMICLNMRIPNLALTNDEYCYANTISGFEAGFFVFPEGLSSELAEVTTDVMDVFYRPVLNCSSAVAEPEPNLVNFLYIILRRRIIHEMLCFMLSGDCMNLEIVLVKQFIWTTEKTLKVVALPEGQITINPNLTRDEYVCLFRFVRRVKDAPIPTFVSTPKELNRVVNTAELGSSSTTSTTITSIADSGAACTTSMTSSVSSSEPILSEPESVDQSDTATAVKSENSCFDATETISIAPQIENTIVPVASLSHQIASVTESTETVASMSPQIAYEIEPKEKISISSSHLNFLRAEASKARATENAAFFDRFASERASGRVGNRFTAKRSPGSYFPDLPDNNILDANM